MVDDTLVRFWTNLAERISGPMAFRFILQPTMASLYAARDGVRDAQANRPAYLWALFTNPNERRSMLREGWASTRRVIALAVVMDAIYQLITVRWIYPMELATTVVLLAIVPYLLLRGPVSRIAGAWLQSRKVPTSE